VTAEATRPTVRPRPRLVGPTLLAAALLVAVVVGSRGITDEGAVMQKGDMPRYLMNGLFLYDFLGSGTAWTFDSAKSYAEHYYARYPALSLGHHPPLLPISLVPFYALLGVSVFAARVAIIVFFVLSVVLYYTLVRRLYDADVAGWACLLFASSPGIATFAQAVLSEMLTMALVLAALNALVRFRDSGRTRDYLLFVMAAVASLLARQLAVLMFPAYAALLLTGGGWTRVARRDVVVITLAGALLVAPIAVATLVFSPFNVTVVQRVFSGGLGVSRWRAVLVPVVDAGLRPALGLLAAAGLLMAIVQRDRRILAGLYWIVSVLAGVFFVTGPVEPGRYSILAVPAYCLCAASLLGMDRPRRFRERLTVVLTFTVMWQFWWGRGMRPPSAGGYEEAARFVLANPGSPPAPTVLYSASMDTGNFVFFVRKHDPAGRLAILRSDKLLTTSLMGQLSVEDRIASPSEIYTLLDRYGTKFVVIEDRPSGSVVLDWLRDELKGSRFIERRRIPIAGAGSPLTDPSLAIYEYTGARSPDPDAEIDIRIPLVGREIHVRLSDLVASVGPAR
jgi:hypothetical protein